MEGINGTLSSELLGYDNRVFASLQSNELTVSSITIDKNMKFKIEVNDKELNSSQR